MTSFTGLLLSLIFTGIVLYVLFFVIRAGVDAGIRRALPDGQLRPKDDEG